MIEQILSLPTEYTVEIDSSVWKFKHLRPREKMQMSRIKSTLIGNVPIQSVSTEDYGTATILAFLKCSFVDGPDWFKKNFVDLADDGSFLDIRFDDWEDEESQLELWKKCQDKIEERLEAKKKCRPLQTGTEQNLDANGSAPDQTKAASVPAQF